MGPCSRTRCNTVDERTDTPVSAQTTAGEPHAESLQKLGPYLCWAVVFADIGTSVYYTPGIVFAQVGIHAALFVAMTTVVFVLLAAKYREVVVRYPEGGGVVTVAGRGIHPFAGVVGGMLILVDYFLTSALSALSGIIYLSVVFPRLSSDVVSITVGALIVLGLLNWIGIKESARVSAVFAAAAFAGQVAILVALLVHVGPVHLVAAVPRVLSGPPLTGVGVLTGYAGAFLAFSGLETVSQIAPAMATPRRVVASRTMRLVLGSILLTSPLLTLFSTTLLDASKNNPNQFISLLGGYAAGPLLQTAVAITAALLLVFASNTAIIGSYHVFLALSRMRFFPEFFAHTNRLRGTPHWAILVVTIIPTAVLVAAQGSVNLLGDMYAFGLLGAFSLTSLALDVVRWRERHGNARVEPVRATKTDLQPPRLSPLGFALGVLTTILVVVAWCTNLVAKPLATEFGGAVSATGVVIALVTYNLHRRRGQTPIFPRRVRPDAPVVIPLPAQALGADRRTLLAVLPTPGEALRAVLQDVRETAEGVPVVFAYQGATPATVPYRRIFEMVDPYFEDREAQLAFAQADQMARQARLRRHYVYIPASTKNDGITRLWHTVQPHETIAAAENTDVLRGIPVDRTVRTRTGALPAATVHYVKDWTHIAG
jgi:amino acid transporter